MSYLSTALQRIAETRHITRSEVARLSGISQSYISRLFTGEYRDLSDANFVSLLKIFAADSAAQAELVAARCMDARACAIGALGGDLVDITVRNSPPASAPRPPATFPQVPLAAETERAFTWLRAQCPLNPDLEAHLVGYAKLTGMK